MRSALGMILLIMFLNNAVADNFYSAQPEGWLNYNYAVKDPQHHKFAPQNLLPAQRMEIFHEYFNNVESHAAEDPSVENIQKLVALQHYIKNMSVKFTTTWQKVLLDYPEYDYELVHPTNQLATQIDHAQFSAEEAKKIASLSQQYGLFFFYSSKDPYAVKMAQSLQFFADKYQIALMGVSMDGSFLNDISNNQKNSGQAERMGVKYFPALYLVNPKTKSFQPLGYGFLSESQLLERFYNVATNFSGKYLMTGTMGGANL
jgi:conjugal transfer pilus assembly protein TraF